MIEKIRSRFQDLLTEGAKLVAELPRNQHGIEPNLPRERLPDYERWAASAVNLLQAVAPSGSYYSEMAAKLMTLPELLYGFPTQVALKLVGLLRSAEDEWNRGLLQRLEYAVAAAAFDDFLDHAAAFHRANKKVEASVLASAVLEDTVKRIAAKNNVPSQGLALEELVDALVKGGVFTQVKAKRVKSYAGVRNHALHAEWDAFDIRDVGQLINGTRELIETFLDGVEDQAAVRG